MSARVREMLTGIQQQSAPTDGYVFRVGKQGEIDAHKK